MSTIASPRDPSTPLRRPPLSPAASSRASLDSSTGHPPHPLPSPNPASAAASPGPNPSSGTPKRANRAALREYYNLKRAAAAVAAEQQQRGENNALGGGGGSEVPHSELDGKDFSAEEYVRRSLSESGLEELLRLYTRVLGEIRALDAEKKGLVYDNYSKLITATETIRKMRSNMDPLNPMASMLDPKIAQIYAQASSIRDALREEVPKPDEDVKRRQRTRELAAEVLAMPQKLHTLVEEGRIEEARQAWMKPRKLLLMWRAKGLGGVDVERCLEVGDSVFEESGSESESEVEST